MHLAKFRQINNCNDITIIYRNNRKVIWSDNHLIKQFEGYGLIPN